MIEQLTLTTQPTDTQPTTELTPLAADIHGLATSIGVLAGKVSIEEWEYLSILRRNLRAAAEQVSERERSLEVPYRTRTESPMLVYVAAPYSDPDPQIQENRAAQASECAGWLMEAGFGVVSPLSMGHHIGQEWPSAPTDFAAWKNTCLQLLESCSAVCVLMLDGVQESVGVATEIVHARKLGIPCNQVAITHDGFEMVPNPEWW